MLFLLLSALADDRYYPGDDGALVSYAEELARGAVVGRTGRVLVRADDPGVLAAHPGVARVDVLPGGLARVVPRPGVDDLALARALHERPDVGFAHPDVLVRLRPAGSNDPAAPDDPLVAEEWHLENTGQGGRTVDVDVDAARAWATATGVGQRIAVLDAGVQVDHPDLIVVNGHDYVDGDEDSSPTGGAEAPHGTCAAGIAAGRGDNGYGVAGVAWSADVYGIRLLGGETSLDDLYNAFTEAVDAGAGVLSNSWGFDTDCEGIGNYSTFREMFRYAERQGRGGLGSVVVFAAGNDGCDIDGDAMLTYDEPIVVAALEWNDRRAGYSNYGDVVDLAAPTGLLTTDMTPGGYGSHGGDDAFVDGFGGTSASTPVVAGVVALLFEANPRLTAAQVREVLCRTAARVDVENGAYDAEGRSVFYGCGRVDAGAAVDAVANGPPSAPEPVLVVEEAWEGRALLAWSAAADPDDDVLGYEVAWWRAGEAEPTEPTLTTTDRRVDLGAELQAGDVVSWWVRAVDPWGPGPASTTTTFTVTARPLPPAADTGEPAPEEPGGCGVPAGRSPWGALAGLAALRWVERRQS